MGGRLIAMGPNIKCVPGAYWDFFDHTMSRLTELSMKEILTKCGFEVESMPGKIPAVYHVTRTYLSDLDAAKLSRAPSPYGLLSVSSFSWLLCKR